MDTARQTVLTRYGISEANFLARGMEAEVYAYQLDTILKLYSPGTSSTTLRHLQSFYASLDRSQLSYAVPRIVHVVAEAPYTITIEQRLTGTPLAERLPSLQPPQLTPIFPAYVQAVRELATITMPHTTPMYKLFDPQHLSDRAAGDWHGFLRQWVRYQLQTLTPAFSRDVRDFAAKRDRMLALLAQPYHGPYALIHGDIFPGNLLVAPDGTVIGLLDFGRFTMYGDPLFDAATAWVFFDMYDDLQADVRRRLLPFVVDAVGEHAVGKLYRYVLVYSLLSANTYAPDCSDGHYAWCVANLNSDTYWENMA